MARHLRRLPSLQALHVFEACARLESFTAAAHELCVTQAAVSARIRQLEVELGARLFVRGRPLRLSPVGEQLWREVARGLSVIREGIDATLAQRKVRLSCTPTFAAAWLAPRLGEWAAEPGRALLEIDATTVVRGVGDGVFDACIRSGFGHWPHATCHRLFAIDRTPMLAPALWRAQPRKDLQSLLRLPLLADPHWERWIAAAGVTPREPLRIAVAVGSQDLGAHIVAGGAGVALLSRRLFAPAIASGRLVAPFADTLDGPDAYYLVRPQSAGTPEADAFCAWLLERIENGR